MGNTGLGGKLCVVCGEDCSGKPRVKDKAGRYFCKPCHERALARAPAKAPPPVAPPDADDPADGLGGLDAAAILGDIESTQGAAGAIDRCEGCGMPMAPGAVVCVNCGHNRTTGRGAKIKVSKEGSGAAGEVAAAVAQALWTKNPLAWAVGGLIGGALGAAVWAAIAYYAHREYGLIAWGVGIASGVGVQAVARQYADVVSGVIAAFIALLAVCAGKYVAASFEARNLPDRIGTTVRATDKDALVRIATDIAAELESKGHVLRWPTGQSNETAVEQHHFPRDVWTDATKMWRSMSPADKSAFKENMEQEIKAAVELAGEAVVQEAVFLESFGFLDLLFFALAVFSAFAVGSGMGIATDD